jgi:trimeric autotransporter adhesin
LKVQNPSMKINVQILLTIGIVTIVSFLPKKALAQPANNLCTNATAITSSTSCVNTAGTVNGATYTALGSACLTTRPDVWYIFTAKSTNPTITVSTLSNARFQVYTAASCGGTATSLFCSGSGTGTVTGLTVGAQYLIRVYQSSNGGTLTFNICIDDPAPTNDLCSGAITLTSGTSCTNTTGNMYGATLTATTVTAPNCASASTYDVWYRFVAQTTNPTITLSNIGSSFTNASMQLLSNNCGSTFTQLYCGSTSIAANHLTPGTTYYIRVYSTGTVPTDPTNAGFDICVTDPVSPPPSNDECANAVNLSVGNICNNLPGDMSGATISSTPLGGSCVGPNAYDVWYKFTAVNSIASVALSGIGANFLNPRIEILSGNCGSLTSLFCGVSTLNATGLITGNTYYVRVYSTTPPSPNGNSRFNICITSSALPAVRFGNSYVNISKKTTGGVVEPGDILEIRMTIHHSSGTMTNLRFVDNTPTNTAMATGATDRIRIITNEGLNYKQYTLAGGDDAATYTASPAAGQYNIRMNLGFGGTNPGIPVNTSATESASATGSMSSADRPRGGGGLLFAVAYRVVVTGTVGSTIQINPAQFVYRTGGSDVTLTATPYQILISEPLSLCTNSIGLNNAAELGGTFGTGTTLNRSFDLSTPIAGYSFMNNVNAYNGLGDGRYAIVNNISPRSSTNRNANRQPNCTGLANDDPNNCNNRMHGGHWDIDGDHTGTNNSIGNLPPAASTNSGYMLMVNADYVASEVYSQTLNNLCPNTYYEFSAWFRNICETCGVDSTGAQFAGTVTAPSAGYVGVYPNLSFALNGLDYYNTGEINVGGWQKKGFVFRTGATQTSATFSIRNNSQGGGGNDWVMDDIAVATCLPTMSYSPTINPFVCESNPITIADTISSFFKNYTTYKWQRSVNGGTNWTDLTGVTTLPDTNYYITSYTIPPQYTTLADNGNLYRVVVATSADNLSDPDCNISDGITITLTVSTCGPPLSVNIISFNGQLVNSKAQLSWSTSQENGPVRFIVERSADGRNFVTAGEVAGYNNGSAGNRYSFTDPIQLTDAKWYRVIMITNSGLKKYSSAIQLKGSLLNFELSNVNNPFTNNLNLAVTVAKSADVSIELSDMSGRTALSTKKMIYAGTNSILLDTQSLPAGVYSLRIIYKDQSIIRRVVKRY